jgi:hypothetical protein
MLNYKIIAVGAEADKNLDVRQCAKIHGNSEAQALTEHQPKQESSTSL